MGGIPNTVTGNLDNLGQYNALRLDEARALGDVAGVHIATATEQVLAGDLEGGIGELTKAQGNPEADRLRNQWERLRLNRQGLVVLGVAQDIARVLAGAETFDAVPHQPTWQKLEQAIAAGKSFSQAYSNLSDEEKTHVAKSLGGHGFLTQLCQIASASHLEILSQQLLALASSYNLSEGHEAGALVIYQALSGGPMGLAKGKVVDDANVALSVMQGEGKYKVAEVVHAARGLQGRLGSLNMMGMLITGGLLSRFVKVWMMGKGIGLVEGVNQARAWELLSATTATAAEVTYVTGWMEMSQHGEINWDRYWKTWAHNAVIFGGVRAGVGMGLAGREAIHGMSAAGLATRHLEYLKVTEGIARHAVPIASLTVLDKATDPSGRSWFSTTVHATATTAELGVAGYLGRAAVPTVHRLEAGQVFKERLYRGITQNPQLTRIYQHAGRNLPDFLGNLPADLATGPQFAMAMANGADPRLAGLSLRTAAPGASGAGSPGEQPRGPVDHHYEGRVGNWRAWAPLPGKNLGKNFRPVPTAPKADLITSPEEAQIEAVAAGMGNRTLPYFRRAMAGLRFPGVGKTATEGEPLNPLQEGFTTLTQRGVEARARLNERRGQLLGRVKPVNREAESQAVEAYWARGRQLLGEETTHGEIDMIAEIELHRRIREQIVAGTADPRAMRAAGYSPTHGDELVLEAAKITPELLAGIVESTPALQSAQGAQALVEASRRYYEAKRTAEEGIGRQYADLDATKRQQKALRTEAKGQRVDQATSALAEGISTRLDEIVLALDEAAQAPNWNQARLASWRDLHNSGLEYVRDQKADVALALANIQDGAPNAAANKLALCEVQRDLIHLEIALDYHLRQIPLQEAMANFLADPRTAQTMTAEMALHQKVLVAAQELENPMLVDALASPGTIASLPKDLQGLAQAVVDTGKTLRDVQRVQGLGNMIQGISFLFRGQWHRVQGQYERAVKELLAVGGTRLTPLLIAHVNQGLKTRSLDPFAAMANARLPIYAAQNREADRFADEVKANQATINALMKTQDKEELDLVIADLQFQRQRAQGFFDHFAQSPDAAVKKRAERHKKEIENLLNDLDFEIKGLADRAFRYLAGHKNSLSLTRQVEACLNIAFRQLNPLLGKIAGQDLPAATVMFEGYARKVDGPVGLTEWAAFGWAVTQMGLRSKWADIWGATRRVHDRTTMNAGEYAATSLFTRQTHHANPREAAAYAYQPFHFGNHHESWVNFFGEGLNSATALQGPYANVLSFSRIQAKTDLGTLIENSSGFKKIILKPLGYLIDLMTTRVGYEVHTVERAVTQGGYALTYGDWASNRIGPQTTLNFPQLTMALYGTLGFNSEPIVPIPATVRSTGRDWLITRTAQALSGRTYGVEAQSNVHASTVKPGKPNSFKFTHAHTHTAGTYLPAGFTADPVLRNNTQRWYWWYNGNHPQHYAAAVPRIDRALRDYRQIPKGLPRDPMLAAEARTFENDPTVFTRDLAKRQAFANHVAAKLTEARAELATMKANNHPDQQAIYRTERRVERYERALLRAALPYAQVAAMRTVDQQADAFASEARTNPQMTPLLQLRMNRISAAERVERALARGETPAPGDYVAALRLVNAYLETPITEPDAVEMAFRAAAERSDYAPLRDPKLLEAERIREKTRADANSLATGLYARHTMLDPVEAVVAVAVKVLTFGAVNLHNPRLDPIRTVYTLGTFIVWAVPIGWTCGLINYFTDGKTPIYHWWIQQAGRHVMAATGYIPTLQPEAVANLETARVQALREGRPLLVLSNHESWLDIPWDVAMLPEIRFGFKKEVGWQTGGALIPHFSWGRHIELDRPNQPPLWNPKKPEKSFLKPEYAKAWKAIEASERQRRIAALEARLAAIDPTTNRDAYKKVLEEMGDINPKPEDFLDIRRMNHALEGDAAHNLGEFVNQAAFAEAWARAGVDGPVPTFIDMIQNSEGYVAAFRRYIGKRDAAAAQMKKAGEDMLKYKTAALFYLSGTRSRGIGPAKKGAAHLAEGLSPEPIIINLTGMGTEPIMPRGWRGLLAGTHYTTNLRVDVFDPRTVEGNKTERINGITDANHQTIQQNYLAMMAEVRQRAFNNDVQARAQWEELKKVLGPGVTMLRQRDWAGVAKWCRTKPLTDLGFLFEVSERFPEIGERVYQPVEPPPATPPSNPTPPPLPIEPPPPDAPTPTVSLTARAAAATNAPTMPGLDGSSGIPPIDPSTLDRMSPDARRAFTTHSSRAAALAASAAPHPNGLWTQALAHAVAINGSTIVASPDRNSALGTTSQTAVWVTIDPSGKRLLRVDTIKPPNDALTAQQLVLFGHWEPATQTLVLPAPHNGNGNGNGKTRAPVQIQSSKFVPPNGPSDLKQN